MKSIKISSEDRTHIIIVKRPSYLEGEAIRWIHMLRLKQAIEYASHRGQRIPLIGSRA